jgi:peptidoglycan/xylan/chitin deacetylase (PgdA/CDA1 family)
MDVEVFETDRRVVALTFDGGASDAAVQDILGALADEGVPATFFVTGQFARTYPDQVRSIAAAGHPVGNHSDTHPHFPQETNEEIRAELSTADASISALTGVATAPLFRFPFGDRTPLDIEVVNLAGYVPIRWTVDTLGWQGTVEGISTAVVRQRILDTLRPGQVVLMHVGAHPDDGSTLDADALPGVIDDLQARGYGFVTVSDLLAEGP